MSRREQTEPDEVEPGPKKLIPRKKWEWVKIDTYPHLDERIRGVDVYRTKAPAPLNYRIVISAFIDRAFRIPAVVAIRNELHIRFGTTAGIEFGVLRPGERKVTEWVSELPGFRTKDVILSNPDFVEWRPDSGSGSSSRIPTDEG